MARFARSAQRLLGASLSIAAVVAACGGESLSTRDDDRSPKSGSAGASGSSALGGSSSGASGASGSGGMHSGGAAGGGTSGMHSGGAPSGGTGGNAGGRSGSSGDGAEGGDDEPDVPRLDGVPIGDCREPSDDELAALGCPAVPPQEGASCSLPLGVSCAYALSTNQGRAYQDLYQCSNDAIRRWWLLQETCGELCDDGGPNVLELDATDCMSRPIDTCELDDVLFAYTPSGRTLLSLTLADVINDCAAGTIDFSVTLELERGCPTRLSTNIVFSSQARACIQGILESKRYACGELLPCVDYSIYLL